MRTTLLAFALLTATACGSTAVTSTPNAPATGSDPKELEGFSALPAVMDSVDNPITSEKVSLGRTLFYETRLSRDQMLSCNSCHDLGSYGMDGKPNSTGFKGQHGGRNAPTVYNAAGQLAQFWDGRAASVEEQAKGPVLNPIEMASADAATVVATLSSIPEYPVAFKAAFPADADPVTFDNMAKAIAAFERKLVTPSRWDLYLAGDSAALSVDERAGFHTFVETGCANCHNGAFVGGQKYAKLGAKDAWPGVTDMGRSKITKNDSDKLKFKVPTLRNIEKTAPYLHDGSVATLDAAVDQMAMYQLGKQLSTAETASIVAWLRTLTGELPKELIEKPVMPKSGPQTPAPQTN